MYGVRELAPLKAFRFRDLPAELRNAVYKHLLVDPEPICLWNLITKDDYSKMNPCSESQTPEMFRANRKLHGEAVSIFCRINCFSFSPSALWTSSALPPMAEVRERTEDVRHVNIEWPVPCVSKHGTIKIDPRDIDNYSTLRQYCPNVREFTLTPIRVFTMKICLESWKEDKVVDLLRLMNVQLKAFPLVERITLRMSPTFLSERVKKIIQEAGWQVQPR